MSTDTILEWERACLELENAKAIELRLRLRVTEKLFPPLPLPEGTHRIDGIQLGNEQVLLVLTQPYSYKVDDALPVGWRSNRLFRTKVELDKREYNKLEDAQKKEVQRWLTIKPGLVQLEVKRPKS